MATKTFTAKTKGQWVQLSTLSNFDFVDGKDYTLQVLGTAKFGDDGKTGILIDSTTPYTYTHKSGVDLYVMTENEDGAVITVSDSASLALATRGGGSGGGSGDAVWGAITGTLSDQTDLADALAAKQDLIDSTHKLSASLVDGLATVATTGAYSDLSGTPTIPTVPENDDTTISLNTQDKLQAIGVKEARTDTAIRFWHGTEAQYNVGGTVKDAYYYWDYVNTSSVTMPSYSIKRLAYGNGTLVVFSRDSTKKVSYSTNNGTSWIEVTLTNKVPVSSATYGNGAFVAVPFNSNVALYSLDDGQTWNEATLPASKIWYVAYGNGKFLAVSTNGDVAVSTDNGQTWSAGTSMPSVGFGQWQSIAFGDGRFVAVVSNSPKAAYTDDDGANWTVVDKVYGSGGVDFLAYGNGRFVNIHGLGSDRAEYSDDGGETWHQLTLPIPSNWNAIAYGDGKFVAVSDSSFAYLIGDTWVAITAPTDFWVTVVYAGNEFIAGATAGESIVINSVYTLDENPTTASTVYSAPAVTSALTITSVGTGTITLSDTNTYTYNADGNQNSYYTVGESYPDYLCFVDGVGVKRADNLITDKQIQADYSQTDTSAVDYIKNKPILAAVATSGVYSDLTGTPSLASVATSGSYTDLSNKPSLATVATSGSYTDLSNKPTINDATITITQGGVSKGSFTLNQTSGDTIALDTGYGPDSSTVSLNASDELQALGVKEARTDTAIRFWHGTQTQWDNGGAVKDTYYGWGKATFSDISTIGNPPQRSYNLIDGDGKLVYLGTSSKLYYSTDLGETWSDVTLSDNYANGSIAYGNNKFVIIYGNKYISSSNLTTWSSAAYFNYFMKFVVFGSNKFVVVGDVNVAEYYYSEDGSSWTTRNMPESATFRVFKFVNNKFIGLTSNKMFISEDGLSWTVRTLPENSSNWNGVAYGNGKYVISQNQGHAYYSDDLSTWTQCNTLINVGNNVLFVNDKFMSFDTVNSAGTLPNGDVVSVSEDGINWGNYNGGGYQFTSILVKDGVVYAVDIESGNKFVEYTGGTLYLTTEDHPTTSSVVYDSSGNQSALTVTTGGTVYIQLSDGSWYDSVGAIITYYSVGESYPNYVCNIDGVGLKIGTTFIADATGNVLPSQTGNSGKYLTTDGTTASWATVSSGGLQNTATGNGSLTILGDSTSSSNAINIGTNSGVGNHAVAIGSVTGDNNYTTANDNAVAIGWQAQAYTSSVAIGESAYVGSINSIAIGSSFWNGSSYDSNTRAGENAISIGASAESDDYSVAVGASSYAMYNYSIALGYGATASQDYEFVVGGYDTINSEPQTFTLMDLSTGKIPNDRIDGATGSFTSQDGKTITVTNGVITSIV